MAFRLLSVVSAVLAFVQAGWTAGITVKADTGVVLLWQSKAGYWAAVKDSSAIGLTDSLYVDDKYAATLTVAPGVSLLLRGETRICLKGNDTSVTIHFDQGQIFFKRDETTHVKSVTIAALGCIFTPVGTAAALKLTKAGEPSVAVVRGKMRVESPKGQAIVVEAGSFGTYSPSAATFKQGKIPPEAAASLEKWSGVTLESPAPVASSASPDSSKSQIDVEKTAPAAGEAGASAAPSNQATSTAQTAPAPAASESKSAQETAPAAPSTAAQASLSVAPEKAQAAPEEKKESAGKENAGSQGVTWEVSAMSVTVNGAQWTRLAISPDIPLWKFGLGLDIECFINEKGEFSQKGWLFGDSTWYTSVLRKIKYIRFGYENDPFFAKVGGLNNVTLGYGFLVDRFTNLLRYPDEKLVGLQVYLNNVGPLGLTVQTMTPDVMEFKDNAGIAAARLAISPLKPTNLPLLGALSIGATYATDLNEFYPARSWPYGNTIPDKNGNGITDGDYAYRLTRNNADSLAVQRLMALYAIDSVKGKNIDSIYRNSVNRYALLGADIGLPVIKTAMLGLDIYGQAGVVADSLMFKSNRTGWGFGAPGARLTIGPLMAKAEYRHVHGRFIPGYFDPYYLNERLQRFPQPLSRSQWLDSLRRNANDLDGIFGEVSMNIFNVIDVDGSYQYMAGANDALDQRFEARGSVGEVILKRLPKLSKLETYFFKTGINRTIVVYRNNGKVYLQNGKPIYDDFFEQTPTLFWGYRVGIEITKGASLIWDMRYGYQWLFNGTYRLVPDNNMSIGTAITF